MRARDGVVGIVTDEGGMTCHAAIVPRELGNAPSCAGRSRSTHHHRNLCGGERVHAEAAARAAVTWGADGVGLLRIAQPDVRIPRSPPRSPPDGAVQDAGRVFRRLW